MDDREVLLSSGHTMPRCALGTWRSDTAVLSAAVHAALAFGVRHLDCAQMYGNEAVIGSALADAIAQGTVTRSELFLCSKLMPTSMHPEAVDEALTKTLSALKTPYLDLYLLHWPYAYPRTPSTFPVPLEERLGYSPERVLAVWRELERAVDAGRIRTLGVSNFTRAQLAPLLAAARVPPAVNQLELHAALAQGDALAWHAERRIAVTGYCPLGSPARPPTFRSDGDPDLLGSAVVCTVATRHARSPAQVLLRWALQRGVVPLPKSVTPARIAENARVFDFALNADDMAALATLDVGHRFSRGEHFAMQGQTWQDLWRGEVGGSPL